jgi:hypothetical protein
MLYKKSIQDLDMFDPQFTYENRKMLLNGKNDEVSDQQDCRPDNRRAERG